MNRSSSIRRCSFILQAALVQTIFVLFFISNAPAQNSSQVKGKVTDAQTNKPLAGASVIVKGKSSGVSTNADGDFSIVADSKTVLVFSSVGYKSTEIVVGSQTTINVQLQLSSDQLTDVVVTALGIKREKRSLGYSVTTVAGSTLTEARETNFVNDLEGKVAGVNVS